MSHALVASKEHGGGASWARDVALRLEAFYAQNARDLPWRHRATDPYAVWVGEVMLQQTRTAVAAPRYERFLVRFPDLASLAGADLEEVLAEWEGLGYYRRAEALLSAARIAFERFGGLPRDEGALRSLPGFGPYTTAAVLSIVWDEPLAATDGNAVRVFSRLGGFPREWEAGGEIAPIDPDPARRRLTGRPGPARDASSPRSEAARAALAHGLHADVVREALHPGRMNQAVMDVGATLCLPRRAACIDCPVQDLCRTSAALGSPRGVLFRRASPSRVRPESAVAVVRLRDGVGRVLAVRRDEGLLRGLWALPTEEEPVAPGEGPLDATGRALERLAGRLARLGIPARAAPVRPFRWTFTHRVWHLSVLDGEIAGHPERISEALSGTWLTADLRKKGTSGFGGPFRIALEDTQAPGLIRPSDDVPPSRSYS